MTEAELLQWGALEDARRKTDIAEVKAGILTLKGDVSLNLPSARDSICNATQRSPSQLFSHPHGLWSLWDMLDHWGYRFLGVGTALAYAETALERHRDDTNGTIAGHGTSILPPDGTVADLVVAKCAEILKLLAEKPDDPKIEYELGAIPVDIQILEAKLVNSRKPHQLEIYTNDILDEVRRIKTSFIYVLSKRWFYALNVQAAEHYGLVAAFGEQFWEKFKNARDDLEHAGNCLALGEGTACVMHLMRTMEIVIRDMGNRLNMTFDLKDTWGGILRDVDAKIEEMPASALDEQQKKHQWSECRNYLWHVKRAHRDDSMHGARSYSPTEAKQVWDAMKDFSLYLITL